MDSLQQIKWIHDKLLIAYLLPMSSFTEFLYSRFLLSDGVSIDTRTLREGNLFFALCGPNFDANRFAKQALDKGASYAVVSDAGLADGDRLILSEDPLQALQELAIFHRKNIKRPVIGITGSNGKTTTKELLTRVLSKKYRVHATTGNYNNHIGVPLTILHIHPQVEIAVIEMGANHVGDIAFLCGIAQPSHGLITNIGRAHTETFGGIEGVIRGKSELFDYLRKTQGTVFINENDSVLSAMKKKFSNPVSFPPKSLRMTSGSPYLKLELDGIPFETQIVGKYNFNNVGAAVALGQFFEVPSEHMIEAISNYVADNARSQVVKKGEVTIFLDAYNANPDSMKAALENLAPYPKKLAILGDMNELENPDKDHKEVLDFAMSLNIECLTVGAKIGRVADASTHFNTKAELVDFLNTKNLSGFHVLLKASRSIMLETIVENI